MLTEKIVPTSVLLIQHFDPKLTDDIVASSILGFGGVRMERYWVTPCRSMAYAMVFSSFLFSPLLSCVLTYNRLNSTHRCQMQSWWPLSGMVLFISHPIATLNPSQRILPTRKFKQRMKNQEFKRRLLRPHRKDRCQGLHLPETRTMYHS